MIRSGRRGRIGAMAMTMGEGFKQVMDQMARETIVSEYVWIHTPPFEAATPETEEKAEVFYQRLVDEDKVMEYLEATAAKPCECCGRV